MFHKHFHTKLDDEQYKSHKNTQLNSHADWQNRFAQYMTSVVLMQ